MIPGWAEEWAEEQNTNANADDICIPAAAGQAGYW